jgi:hypothetical protein
MEQQKMHRRHLLILLSACFTATGCATLNSPVSDVFSVSHEPAEEAGKSPEGTSLPDAASFVVELRGSNNESQKFKRPLTDESTYVQGVLVESNARKHLGRVKIELWRPRPDGQGYYKIDIPYDRKQRAVPPAYDYAIREGDRLVFMKDDATLLDDMLESLGRPERK